MEKADVYYQNTQRNVQNEEKGICKNWMGRRKLWKMIKWKNKIWIYYKASFSHLYNFNNSPSFSFHSLLIICIQGYSLDILYEERANREYLYMNVHEVEDTTPLDILFLFLMLSLTTMQIQPPSVGVWERGRRQDLYKWIEASIKISSSNSSFSAA